MAKNLATKLIEEHLLEGQLTPGREIGLHIDQALLQDATGTLVMLELEALGLDRAATELAVQYVDHNLLQTDERNADDHLFLQSAARRFGLWFSGPGNGVSHPTHQQRFGRPGAALIGSDSHTCAAGAIGMLAIGVGGLDVAMVMAGEPLYLTMPEIWGVRLTGTMPPWVSAKDVILEMLRRYDVKGGVNRMLEYHGPGLDELTAMDRHVIANMGAELGATASVFPSDDQTLKFLRFEGREDAWVPLQADEHAAYDIEDEIDLSGLEPLIAKPSSPGNVVPVRTVAGEPVAQVVVGSSANPGLRDFAAVAQILRGQQTYPGISVDINPTSREILQDLARGGWLFELIRSGARIHQTGCLGCIGMGQAPATGRNSLRTMPRNFPGRSGTDEDSVWLCSPETAAAAALTGRITDPRDLPELFGVMPPRPVPPRQASVNTEMLRAPEPPEVARKVELVKGPNITTLPEFDELPDRLEVRVLLRLGDNISTDEIMPAGARVLPYRSNIEKLSQFVYHQVDPDYVRRARDTDGDHAIVGGENYGQGSSREHAALAPRFLGLRLVIARSYARIHWQNLVNFGILPLQFDDPADLDDLRDGDALEVEDVRSVLVCRERQVLVGNSRSGRTYATSHRLSPRQVEIVLAGGQIPRLRANSGMTDAR